ncbi:TonB-dependent receptor [Fulvitalea axinellae]|uniref:TonB-dependent receptor n=1 Tax=Fulvitalea axinellae TaxID=1182444 RepID=A0AAU9C882_9BACT|nr:TonB-dependent receptor [Fulvitalea axinellae]
MRKFLLSIFMLFAITAGAWAQTVIKGHVVDAETQEDVLGANVFLKGTSEGAITDLNGKFSFKTSKSGSAILVISFIGFEDFEKSIQLNGGTLDLGALNLTGADQMLNEVEVIADIAVDRKTPVAISNIKPEAIEEKLGTQEFPEVLKSTPGVYATKQGGGYGDARVNIRGFDSDNVGVLINGVPINDMESGQVYWSNWAGLSDVTRSMQVQRGLGASKLAISSIGGTINIITKSSDMRKGGSFGAWIGNDGYSKQALTLSTGMMDNGYSVTFSGSKTTGDGYVDGTAFDAWSYFLAVSKTFNDNHELVFTVFGAPQEHGQRSTRKGIEYFEANGIKENFDWGYKAGQEFNVRKNYYHKPQATLNHYWTISDKTDLATSVYASRGTGGGSGWYGTQKDGNDYRRSGLIDFDKIVDENVAAGKNGSETIIRNSVNNHTWFGALSSLTHEANDVWTFNGGLDARYYIGQHYREVRDLLGGDFYVDDKEFNTMKNTVAREGDKVNYHNDGHVGWLGTFFQAEYSKNNLSAFASATLSGTWYKRVDYFNYFSDGLISELNSNPEKKQTYIDALGQPDFDQGMKGQESDWVDFLGYGIKGGANYNINDSHNVFANVGYFSRAPFFRSVFLNYKNDVNEDAENEKVFSLELGYGFRSEYFSANINAYRTLWKDKSVVKTSGAGEQQVVANLTGVNALHQGIEVDFLAKPARGLEIRGMASFGDWTWQDDLTEVGLFDQDQNLVDVVNIYIADLKVGDAAQTTLALGADYEIFEGFKVGMDYNYYDNLYAKFDPADRGSEAEKGVQAWELPEYGLFDANVRYKFKLGQFDATLYGKLNNIFDEEYVSDAEDGTGHDWQSANVYYGFGRTWSMGLKVKF